jgi:hypothetical protein
MPSSFGIGKVVNAEVLNSNVTTAAGNINGHDVHAVINCTAGTPTATVTLETAPTPSGPWSSHFTVNATSGATVAGGTGYAVSGVGVTHFLAETNALWARLRINVTAGSGTFDAFLCAKHRGAQG